MNIFLYIILLLIFLFSTLLHHIVFPVLIILFFLIIRNRLIKLKFKYNSKSISLFWIDEEDQKMFKELNTELIKRYSEINSLHEHAKEAEISKNMDGSYSNRSNLGKQINERLASNQNSIKLIENKHSILENKPINNWKSFINVFININSLFVALITMVFSYLYLFLSQFQISDLIKTVSDGDRVAVLIYVLINLVIGLIAYIFSYLFFKIQVLNQFPKPPLVDGDNFDKPINF